MLITCGNCGCDVSDKAVKCPSCQSPVNPLSISCPECSKEISRKDFDSDCPHCGHPLRYLRQEEGASQAPLSPPPPAQAAAKGGLRSCLLRTLAYFAAALLLLGAAFALLKHDAFGMKTSLKQAVESEETPESAGNGDAIPARLWVKHFLSQLLDGI